MKYKKKSTSQIFFFSLFFLKYFDINIEYQISIS